MAVARIMSNGLRQWAHGVLINGTRYNAPRRIGKDEADVYAEGLRRGGAVVSARVADNDAARLQAIMDRSAVRVADRAAAYRKSGWKTFDANATPYNADQVKKERSLNM